jgi:hypothetical protein
LSVDSLNYADIAERVLKVGAEIARRTAVKRNPPDALAIKACIDALDKKLGKLERMADGYRAEFSSATVVEFPTLQAAFVTHSPRISTFPEDLRTAETFPCRTPAVVNRVGLSHRS